MDDFVDYNHLYLKIQDKVWSAVDLVPDKRSTKIMCLNTVGTKNEFRFKYYCYEMWCAWLFSYRKINQNKICLQLLYFDFERFDCVFFEEIYFPYKLGGTYIFLWKNVLLNPVNHFAHLPEM